MTNLIPAIGHVAVYARTGPDGTNYAFRIPVVAWDANGNAYVHDDQFGGLTGASTQRGYKKTEVTNEPVVAAIPAVGWSAEYDEDGAKGTDPVIAWLVRADGTAEPVSMGSDGSSFDPSTVDNFVRLVGPGESS